MNITGRPGRRAARPPTRNHPPRLDACWSVTFLAATNAVSIPKERLAASLVVGTVRRLSAPQLTRAMAKAACSRARLSKADRARSLSTRARPMTFIMVLSSLALRQHLLSFACMSTARTGHGHCLPLQ